MSRAGVEVEGNRVKIRRRTPILTCNKQFGRLSFGRIPPLDLDLTTIAVRHDATLMLRVQITANSVRISIEICVVVRVSSRIPAVHVANGTDHGVGG